MNHRSGGSRRGGGARRLPRPGPDGPAPGTVADLAADADPTAVARTIALRQLTAAPRTRAQLDDALARRGVPEEVGEALLDRLEEVGLVDDAEFARMWVESRHAGRGLSRRALRHELAHRGVDPELARQAAETVDDDAELAAAVALVRRRLTGSAVSAVAAEDRARRDRRLLGMLARRGYGSGLAHRALRQALDEAGGSDPVVEPVDEPD